MLNAQTSNGAVKEYKNVNANSTEYGIKLSPAASDIAVGKTGNFVALYGPVVDGALSGSPENVTTMTTWTSSDPSVVTVGSDGGLTGISKGTAVITANYDGYVREATVRVFNSITNELKVNPTTLSVGTGKTVNVTATYYTYGDGEIINSKDVTSAATWTSNNNKSSVTKGVVKGLSVGSSVITAKYATYTATVDVTVYQSYNATLLVIAQGNPIPALTNELFVYVQDNNDNIMLGEPENANPWSYDSMSIQKVPTTGAFINETTTWAYKDLSVFDNMNPFTIVVSGVDLYVNEYTVGGSHSDVYTPIVESESPTTLLITVNVDISSGNVKFLNASVVFR